MNCRRDFRLVVPLLLGLSFGALAEAPPSDGSLRELLEVTDARKLVDSALLQMEQVSDRTAQQAMAGKDLSAANQESIQKFRARLSAILRDELSWEKLEPMYLDIYRSSLSQDEVDGMLKFYKSDAGRAMTRKMPDIMQASVVEMQKRIPALIQRLEEARNEFVREMQQQPAAGGSAVPSAP